MNDYYTNPRTVRIAEERMNALIEENTKLKNEIAKVRTDYDANMLRHKLMQISTYDEQVRLIISADPRLQEAWDNFRVQYQLTASRHLLETAQEKINRKEEGICHGCKRPFAGNDKDDRRAAQKNILLIKTLERELAEAKGEIE